VIRLLETIEILENSQNLEYFRKIGYSNKKVSSCWQAARRV